jgi:hypothetical protein
MGQAKNDVLEGTLALLVLKTLERGAAHGYGMLAHTACSSELLRVRPLAAIPEDAEKASGAQELGSGGFIVRVGAFLP